MASRLPILSFIWIYVIFVRDAPNISEAVLVLQFQENRIATTNSYGTYAGLLDSDWKMDSITLCARFQLFILHGWATFFHLQDVERKTVMMLVGEVWIERVRPVIARNWNFQNLKEELRMYRWYHLCFTYDHTTHLIKTYIDGKLNNHQEYDVGRPVYGDTVILGQGDIGERSLSGKLSQVNVWDRALSEEEIFDISSCAIDLQGNYLSWEEGWKLNNVSSYDAQLEDFCRHEYGQLHFWFPQLHFGTAQYLCDALGAELPRPTSLRDITAISELANASFPESTACSYEYWTSLSDIEEEGVWRYGDGKLLENQLWLGQEPNGLQYENCGVLTISGLADLDCKVDKKCVVCTFQGQQRFSLLGSCETELRNVYFIAYQAHLGEVYFMGYGEYYIRKEKHFWVWVDDVTNITIAKLEVSPPNYPMGRRWWTLERRVCHQHPGERRRLLLTPCSESEFTCDDGTCIPHEERCDLKYDCRDNSDEADCHLIYKPDDYQRHLPPRSSDNEQDSGLLLIASITIETMSVKTIDMAIDISFELLLTWEDNRLKFLDLKVNSTLNVLSLDIMKTLWTPEVTFANAVGNQHTHVDEYTTMKINRWSDTKIRNVSAPAEVDVFPGELNSLSMRRKYGITYNCDLGLQLYPFDGQVCSMHLKVRSAPKAFLLFDSVNSSARNSGKSRSAEYDIGDLRLVFDESGTYSSVHVMIPLNRLSGYAILNIYIPTLVLLVISYVTLFVRTDMFEVRMMGALTVQLVIATLFSQVSASLPKTSYFKMVDVWLLFCIGLTFLVIIFHAIIDQTLYKNTVKAGGADPSSDPAKVPWAYPLSKMKEIPDAPKKTPTHMGQKMVKLSKIMVMLTFAIFNVCYWGYIASEWDN